MQQAALDHPSPPDESPVLSVWELNRSIRSLLEGEIGSVWVEGEISNYRRQSSGHQYFTLKDDRSQLSCVLFRGKGQSLGGADNALADGAHVQLYGEVTLYEARGQHQLVVQLVQARGVGALQARFEALKRKLQAEGLFDPARKRPLPRFPAAVGLVTSPTGAALRDMLNVLARRAPQLRLLLHPVRVQGAGAAAEIAAAIRDFNAWAREPDAGGAAGPKVDLIVLARGGGSIEDLWEFNDEALARAIAASALPVVSAVGHEIDFTISDFAADLRAPTPSAAAELIAPDAGELRRQLAGTLAWFNRQLADRTGRERERLRVLARGALGREPLRRLEQARQRIDLAEEALERAARAHLSRLAADLARLTAGVASSQPACWIENKRQALRLLRQRVGQALANGQESRRCRLEKARGLLRVLGPQATLERGYSITLDGDGQLVRRAAAVRPGGRLVTRLSDGEVRSTVE